MTRQEHLLTTAMEECAELIHKLSKVKRFGADDHEPGQSLTNREQVIAEFTDLVGAMELAGYPLEVVHGPKVDVKIAKIEAFLAYSAERGTLTEPAATENLRRLAYWEVSDDLQALRTRLACIGAALTPFRQTKDDENANP